MRILEKWEHGGCIPEISARAYLTVIGGNLAAVIKALHNLNYITLGSIAKFL